MKKGKLSNIPAPSVYIDGASLFDLSGLFGSSPRLRYKDKLIKLMRYANVVIFIEKRGRVSRKMIEKSPFIYTEVLELNKGKFIKLLRRNKTIVFCSEDRAEYFNGICALLDASAENILAEVGA